MKKLALKGRVLALLEGSDESVYRVSRNLPRFETLRAQDVTSYDIMKNSNLLLTQTAFKTLMERVKP